MTYIRCEITLTSAGGEQQNYISGGILEKFVTGQKDEQKMPIKIQGDLPVKEILERENIFVIRQKIRLPII